MIINFKEQLNNKDNYPLILVPNNIIDKIQEPVDKLEVCKYLNIRYPSQKREHIPIKPNNFKSVKTKKLVSDMPLGCALIILAPFCIIALYAFISASTIGFGGIIGSGISSLFVYFLAKEIGVRYKNEYVDIKLSNKEYQELLKKYEFELDEIDKLNEKYKIEYEQKREVIENEINKNYSKVYKKIYTSKLIPLMQIKKTTENYKRGKSELFFLNTLIQYFGKQLNVDVVLDDVSNQYQPDFVLICEETNFHLDIELDEPYSFEGYKPIHHDRCNDNERNNYFLKNNWGVVRFSEKQIVKNPDDCCALIQNIINAIKNKELTFESNVPKEKKWSYEEALVMSFNNYRDNYLAEMTF